MHIYAHIFSIEANPEARIHVKYLMTFPTNVPFNACRTPLETTVLKKGDLPPIIGGGPLFHSKFPGGQG